MNRIPSIFWNSAIYLDVALGILHLHKSTFWWTCLEISVLILGITSRIYFFHAF